MYILFDIGGTNTRVAVSGDGQTIGDVIMQKTDAHNFDTGVDALIATARKLTGGQPITAAAGGVPGPLSADKSCILSAPNLPGWANQPLKARLAEAFGAPAYLENDTVMIGMGEAASGAGQGKKICVYLTVSTGVGGARIVDGLPDANKWGFEPGHQIIDRSEGAPICGCGGRGHLEALVSGINLEKRHGMPPAEISNVAVWEEVARDLAIGLNNVLVFWSPDVIILGGSVMQKIDIELVRRHLREIVTVFPDLPPIEPARLGQTGGLAGALAYLKKAGA